MRPFLKYAVLILLCTNSSHALEVSRIPPDVYKEHLEPLLTPLEEVLEGKSAYKESSDGGVVLLKENITYIAEDGRRYSLNHRIDYTRNESGIEYNKEYTHTYDKDRQLIYLISAGTYQPDLTYQEVDESAAFIQTPQHEAENSLYTSEAELTIIFPNVDIGTITQSITIVETFEQIIPGEISLGKTFSNFWPTFRSKLTYITPNSYADRIRFKKNSSLIPEPSIREYSEGNTIFQWDVKELPDYEYEYASIRSSRILPYLITSTLPDWNAFGDWFRGLVSERESLDQELIDLVEEWTDGIENTDEIIQILAEKVSNEVRYTGLEFGLAGYQPYSCSTVWKNRYGDCKDKTNLLRALLKQKSIDSHFGLLYTKGHGVLEKDIPRYGQFNHAILVIPQSDGNYTYVDPTIENISAGKLSYGDSGRDILIIKDDGIEWATTPDLLVGQIHLNFDLKLELNGEYNGWVTITTKDVDAASYQSYFEEVQIDIQKNRFQSIVQDFMPDARVIDLKYDEESQIDDQFSLSAYIITDPGSELPDIINFPFPVSWLPDFEAKKTRLTPYRTTRRILSVEASVELPEGVYTQDYPQALNINSVSSSIDAKWVNDEGKISAVFEYYPKKMVLSPNEYQNFHTVINAAKSWLTKPMLLTADIENIKTYTANQNTVIRDLPMLSTGSGQLALIEERYPEGNNNIARRDALDKTIQWFENDPETVFEAKVKIAILDWEDDSQKFIEGLEKAISMHRNHVSLANLSWAEYLWARGKWESDQDQPAMEKLISLSQNTSLNEYRRGWSAYYAAYYLSDINPEKAKSIILDNISYASEARYYLDQLYTSIVLNDDDISKFAEYLEGLKIAPNSSATDRIMAIIDAMHNSRETLSESTQKSAIDAMIARYADVIEDLPEDSLNQYNAIRTNSNTQAIRAEFQETLRKSLRKQRPSWYEKDYGLDNSAEELIAGIQQANDEGDPSTLLNSFIALVLGNKASYDDLVQYLRWTLWWMQNQSISPRVYNDLAEASLKLRMDSESHLYQLLVQLGSERFDNGEYSAAIQYYRRLLEIPFAEDYQKAQALIELAKIEVELGNNDNALEYFKQLEPIHQTNTHGTDFLLLYLFFALENNQLEEAARLLKKLPNMEQQWIEQSSYYIVTLNLLRSLEHPDNIMAYWERAEEWWPQWRRICRSKKVDPGSLKDLWSMDELDQIQGRIQNAVVAKDSAMLLEAIKPIVLVARWVPIFIVDFNAHIAHLASFDESMLKRLRSMALDMSRDIPDADPQYTGNIAIVELQNLIELGRHKSAPRIAKKLIENETYDRDIKEAALRLWLISSRLANDNFDEPATIMEEWLQSDYAFSDRALSVRILSDGYYLLNQFADLVSLVDRELKNQSISEDEELRNLLNVRKDAAVESSKLGSAFTKSVQKWIDKVDLDVFEYIGPSSLDYSNPSHLHGPIIDDTLNDGTIKLNLLFALDPNKPLNERRSAFSYAVIVYSQRINDIDKLERGIWAALEMPQLTKENKEYLVEWLTLALFNNFYYDIAEDILWSDYAQDIDEGWIDSSLALVDSIKLFLTLENEEIEGCIEPIQYAAVTNAMGDFITQLLTRLIYLGQLEKAQEIFKLTEDMKAFNSSEKDITAYRLEWMRLINTQQLQYTFNSAFRELILSKNDSIEKEPKNFYETIRHLTLDNLSYEEQLKIIIYSVSTGIFKSTNIYEMAAIYLPIHFYMNKEGDFGLQYYTLVAEHLGNDLLDSIRLYTEIMPDIDNPEIYPAYLEIMKTMQGTPGLSKQTLSILKILDLFISMRVRPPTLMADLFPVESETNVPDSLHKEMQFRYYYNEEQWNQVDQILNNFNYTENIRLQVLAEVHGALEHLQRNDEAQLLRELIITEIDKSASECWLVDESLRFENILWSAATLDDVSILPEELFNYRLSEMGENLDKWKLEILMAFIQHDWKEVISIGKKILESNDELYYTYGLRGYAYAQIEDKESAKSDLATFLKYERGSPMYNRIKNAYSALSANP